MHLPYPIQRKQFNRMATWVVVSCLALIEVSSFEGWNSNYSLKLLVLRLHFGQMLDLSPKHDFFYRYPRVCWGICIYKMEKQDFISPINNILRNCILFSPLVGYFNSLHALCIKDFTMIGYQLTIWFMYQRFHHDRTSTNYLVLNLTFLCLKDHLKPLFQKR